jgi:hypothetical protein
MTHYLVNYHTTGHLVFVLVPIHFLMIRPAIYNPASCEIRSLIGFLHVENISAVKM